MEIYMTIALGTDFVEIYLTIALSGKKKTIWLQRAYVFSYPGTKNTVIYDAFSPSGQEIAVSV